MWAIVGKDFKQIGKMGKRIFLAIMGFGIFFLIFSRSADALQFGLYMGVFGATILGFGQVMFNEERWKGYLFLRSLPVPPKDIVKAKYVLFLLIYAGALLVNGILFGIMAVKFPLADREMVLFVQVFLAWAVLIYISLFMALSFRFGTRWAQILLMLFVFGISFGIPAVLSQTGLVNPGPMPELMSPWFLGPVALIPLVLFFGSMLYSIRVFRRPEFLER